MFIGNFALRCMGESGKRDAKECNDRERFHECRLRRADRRETRILD
jgi:hypothetical protein